VVFIQNWGIGVTNRPENENKLRNRHPDWNWDYWEAQIEIRCVVCEKHDPFCIKTPNGEICPTCIAVFVDDVIFMRKPWNKALWKTAKND